MIKILSGARTAMKRIEKRGKVPLIKKGDIQRMRRKKRKKDDVKKKRKMRLKCP